LVWVNPTVPLRSAFTEEKKRPMTKEKRYSKKSGETI